MKKLSYLIVFVTLSLTNTVFAQDIVEASTETIQQEKNEIQIGELPEAITNALTSEFSNYTTNKAFKSTLDGQEVYYVQLTNTDVTSIEVLFNNAGKIIEQKDLE